jgi:alanine racemase
MKDDTPTAARSSANDTLARIRPTWAEIDLAAFDRNIDAIVRPLPEGSRLIAVLKADGYGHGAVELARRCTPDRVAMIAVALLEEAMELRSAGISIPIIVLGPLESAQVPIAAQNEIVIGVTSPEVLQRVCSFNGELRIALKLDSGMGRMGLMRSELRRTAEMILATPRLRVDAIYTHFASSGDPRDGFTETQNASFDAMVQALRAAGINAPLHRANSAATMRGLVNPGEDVRVGIALYGAEALEVGNSRLEPLMRWRTEIARLKRLPAGHAVGYGETFHTTRDSDIATLPVGYADGYNRLLSNRGHVLVHGRRAPVVGRVSMDLVTIDVTDIESVAVGDEVVLLGSQGDETIKGEEIASLIGTISYEVFCNVSARVPRVYREGERVTVRSRFTS